MTIDYSKIETVNKFARRYYEGKTFDDSMTLFVLNWVADYSIKVKKANQSNDSKDDEGGKTLKTMIDCSLSVKNMFNILQTDINSRKFNFTIGDIANEFLLIFTPMNNNGSLDLEIDIDLLNSFIEKFRYPPVGIEVNSKQQNQDTHIGIDKNGIHLVTSTCGYKKETVIYYPIDNQIKEYVNALKELYFKIYDIICGIGVFVFDVTFHHHFETRKDQFLHDRLIHQESINSIVLYDAKQFHWQI